MFDKTVRLLEEILCEVEYATCCMDSKEYPETRMAMKKIIDVCTTVISCTCLLEDQKKEEKNVF